MDNLIFGVLFFIVYYFFFFQAEDGIRDRDVTGVQTCALPICPPRRRPRCSRRASAASAAAGGSGASGPVIAIAGAASSALRRSSASMSRQAAQPCTWLCSGAGVPPGTSSRDARSAPRSGQGIVGSRIGVVIGEIGVTECPLPTGEQHPDRADSQVQGCGDLRVGEAGVAQQQAGALPLRQGGEGPAHGPLLLGAKHVQ